MHVQPLQASVTRVPIGRRLSHTAHKSALASVQLAHSQVKDLPSGMKIETLGPAVGRNNLMILHQGVQSFGPMTIQSASIGLMGLVKYY